MSIEAFVLALTTIVRPSTVAALVGILATRGPQRLLWAYLLAGLAFSLAFGFVVVVLMQGLSASVPAVKTAKPWVEIALGVLSIGYGVGMWVGWLPRRHEPGPVTPIPARRGRLRTRLSEPTASTTAVAGILTHLPGIVYLAALNAIVADQTGAVDGLVQVTVYNLVWFSLPIAALVLSVRRPSLPRELLATTSTRLRRHRRPIFVVLALAIGGYLLVSGLVAG